MQPSEGRRNDGIGRGLAAVIESWGKLPQHVQNAILTLTAMVQEMTQRPVRGRP